MNFFNKEFRKISLENIDKSNMFWAWIGSFLGIIAISYFKKFVRSMYFR